MLLRRIGAGPLLVAYGGHNETTATWWVGIEKGLFPQAVAHTGSWRLDVRRNELTWSDENHRIFGIPKETTMTYETFLGTVHSDDRAYVHEKWSAALRGEPYDIEHRIVADGRVKWVRERAELEFDKEGQLLGGFGMTQDITQRKEMEEALKVANAFTAAILERISDSFFALDRDLVLTYYNLAAEQVLGRKVAAALGKKLFDAFPDARGVKVFPCSTLRSFT